jgi:hypothetical protein
VARAVEQNLNWFLIAVGFALFGLAAVPAAGYYSDPRTAAIGRLQSLGARWLKTDRDYTQSQSDGD